LVFGRWQSGQLVENRLLQAWMPLLLDLTPHTTRTRQFQILTMGVTVSQFMESGLLLSMPYATHTQQYEILTMGATVS
jgi:hypothetical protein